MRIVVHIALLILLCAQWQHGVANAHDELHDLEPRTLDSTRVDEIIMDDRYIYGREEMLREKRLREGDSWFKRMIEKLFGGGKKKKQLDGEHVMTFYDYLWMFIKYLLITAFIVGVIYFLFKGQIQNAFRKQKDKSLSKVSKEEADIHELDVEELLQQAIKEKDLKKAVRIQFLHVLKILSENNLIHWKPDKTNRDYFFELRKKKLHNHFNDIALTYEYVWYGDKAVSQSVYDETEQQFRSFLKQVDNKKHRKPIT